MDPLVLGCAAAAAATLEQCATFHALRILKTLAQDMVLALPILVFVTATLATARPIAVDGAREQRSSGTFSSTLAAGMVFVRRRMQLVPVTSDTLVRIAQKSAQAERQHLVAFMAPVSTIMQLADATQTKRVASGPAQTVPDVLPDGTAGCATGSAYSSTGYSVQVMAPVLTSWSASVFRARSLATGPMRTAPPAWTATMEPDVFCSALVPPATPATSTATALRDPKALESVPANATSSKVSGLVIAAPSARRTTTVQRVPFDVPSANSVLRARGEAHAATASWGMADVRVKGTSVVPPANVAYPRTMAKVVRLNVLGYHPEVYRV